MSRRVLSCTLSAGVLLAVGLPAAAQAATLTVDPGAPAGCDAANACKTVADALGKAAAGDTVTVNDGTYNEAPLTLAAAGVTLKATNAGRAVIVGQGTGGAATLSLTGADASLDGLVLATGGTGGPVLSVRAPGAKVARSSLGRIGATTDQPALAVDDSGAGFTAGATTVTASAVVELPTLGSAGTAPAVQGGTRSSLVVEDSLVISGAQSGPAVALAGSDQTGGTPVPNRLTRGSFSAAAGDQDAVSFTSASNSTANKSLVVDSAALLPGPQGAGLHVESLAGQLAATPTTSGSLTATLHHITIAGGARPFEALANATGAGNVTVTADRSILHGAGPSTVTSKPGTTVPLTGTVLVPANQATVTETDSDATDTTTDTAAAKTTVTGGQKSADTAIFAAPGKADPHVLPTAPVIDKGGPVPSGQSDKDFEGEARGATTDIGADEYMNLPPVARLAVDKETAKVGEPVSFDLSGSVDPGAGGMVTAYAIDPGDGSGTLTGGAKASHAYTAPGTYTVVGLVSDGPGQVAITSASVTVTDAGTPPTLAISGPANGSSLKLFKTKVTRKTLKPAKAGGPKRRRTTTTRKLNKITLSGTASDPSGLRSVELSLRRVSTTGKLLKAKTVKVTKLRQAGGSCTYLDAAKRTFVGSFCSKPLFFVVAAKPDGSFAYTLKGTKYRAGTYTLTARATDVAGNVSTPVTTTFKLTQ